MKCYCITSDQTTVATYTFISITEFKYIHVIKTETTARHFQQKIMQF